VRKINLKGQRFGRLLVIEEAGKAKSRHILWRCICDCGGETRTASCDLRSDSSTSCGCKRIKHGYARKGQAHPLHGVWRGMIDRCNNPKAKTYKYYGGRGIKICEQWERFINFYNDMINSYRSGLSIDRINNDGDYEPENCRWATRLQQNRNKRKKPKKQND